MIIRLSPEQAEYLIDALDTWIEGYRTTAEEAHDTKEVSKLMEQMEIGMKIRSRIWKRFRKYVY